jgi:hypothetical protein
MFVHSYIMTVYKLSSQGITIKLKINFQIMMSFRTPMRFHFGPNKYIFVPISPKVPKSPELPNIADIDR